MKKIDISFGHIARHHVGERLAPTVRSLNRWVGNADEPVHKYQSQPEPNVRNETRHVTKDNGLGHQIFETCIIKKVSGITISPPLSGSAASESQVP